VVDLRSVIGEEGRIFPSVRWRGRSWKEEASAVLQNCLPPFLIVLVVFSTVSTLQLHVGVSPNPLQPPLLQDKLWFRINHELWEQEEDDWALDISSMSRKIRRRENHLLGHSPQNRTLKVYK